MSTKLDIWMPLYINEYDAATARLSDAEDCSYMALIKDYWRNGPPPDDDAVLARIARRDPRAWKKIRLALIGFFRIEEGRWRHKRIDFELARARKVSDARRAAGKSGGRPTKAKTEKQLHPQLHPQLGKQNGSQNGSQNETQSQSHSRKALIEPIPTERVTPPQPHERQSAITPEERASMGEMMKGLASELRQRALERSDADFRRRAAS